MKHLLSRVFSFRSVGPLLRRVLALASCGLLLACGEARDDLDLFRGSINKNAPRFHPRANQLALLRPIPPRLEVSFPSRDLTGVMLLESQRNGVDTWLTADGATITLNQGVLTSAKGFGSGMTASDLRQTRTLLQRGGSGTVERFHSFLNGNDDIELRAYKCEIEPVGQEDIFLQGNPVPTIRVEERCFGLSAEFTNTYWIRKTSPSIVQSSQWTGDFLGNLFMKVVPDEL